ncbi:MAG: sodium:proton antiporter [Calditrichia bacterium]
MSENFLIGLSAIIVLGIVAQWIAWRIQVPSILVLLVTGFLAGPVTGFIDPGNLLGDSLFPIVSISVAIILFEGGLSLHFPKLKGVEDVVRQLVSTGVIVTWVTASAAAYLLLDLSLSLSILLGAILVVTGPTVVIPLLQHLRVVNRIGSVARWEGIINDPIGASLAVLVFEVIQTSAGESVTTVILSGFIKTTLLGIGLGFVGAVIMVLFMKKYWIPDYLQSPFALMMAVFVFAVSNYFQHESGLLAVTMMGIFLANQKYVTIQHIAEFKENLRVLLISGLFILLAARLQISSLSYINLNSFIFLAVLIFVARPLAVWLSTIRSQLNWKERVFLFWMAPRGIVAAAVSSVFALALLEGNHQQAVVLVPLTFLVIIGTVTFYGLTAAPVARWLGLAKSNPQGVIFVGAHDWARAMARELQDTGIQVLLADSNYQNISSARIEGLPTYYGNILSESAIDEIDTSGLGRLIALTANDEVNSLAALHFMEIFERAEVYHLPENTKRGGTKSEVSRILKGRTLFGNDINYDTLSNLFSDGAELKSTPLSEEFDYQDFRKHYKNSYIPLFLVDEDGNLTVIATDNTPTPEPGQTLISLIKKIEVSLP